jgi:hypothetical protein
MVGFAHTWVSTLAHAGGPPVEGEEFHCKRCGAITAFRRGSRGAIKWTPIMLDGKRQPFCPRELLAG